MGELSVVVLALAAAAGAWMSTPLPLAPAAVLVAAALAARRPLLLALGVALATSAVGARAWDGLHPPSVGAWSGTATLVGDPAEVAGALRVDVRIGGKRVEAWARGSTARALVDRLAGERVTLRGRLQAVPDDARARLALRHVAARMTVESASFVSAGDLPSRLANGLRRTLLRGAEVLPPERRALFAGFVLGDDRQQRPEVTDDFRASGLSHLLVVSGENVAFVLALLSPFLNRFRLGGRLVGGLAALALFGILTRWEPSVLRAETMAALALLAATLGRPVSTLRVVALAVTGLLLVDPLLVRSIGFLLSVGACVGIALLAAPIAARLPGPRPLAAALGVTLAAQVGVLPVLIPAFGGTPVAALPANLLAVPVAGPIMMWGMSAGVAAGWTGPLGARLLHLPTSVAIAWVDGVAHRSAALPLGQLRLWHVVALAAALVVGVVAHRHGRRRFVIAAGLAAAAVALAPAVAVLRPSAVHGRALVPGARLWRDGGAAVLVVDDLKASPQALLSSLHDADVRRLDVVVVTRPGPAAASDVDALLHRFPPRLLLGPPGNRLPAPVSVPPDGSRLTAGGLVVSFAADGARLAVTVGSARAPPGSVGGRMRLALGSRTYDLDRRALVVGVQDAPGADLVDGAPAGFATAADEDALERALDDGACLIRLPAPTPELLPRGAAAGVSVVVPAGAPDDRTVPDLLFLDVADDPCPLPAIAAGIVGGARIVRTRHPHVALRVADVLAAIWQAGE